MQWRVSRAAGSLSRSALAISEELSPQQRGDAGQRVPVWLPGTRRVKTQISVLNPVKVEQGTVELVQCLQQSSQIELNITSPLCHNTQEQTAHWFPTHTHGGTFTRAYRRTHTLLCDLHNRGTRYCVCFDLSGYKGGIYRNQEHYHIFLDGYKSMTQWQRIQQTTHYTKSHFTVGLP